MSHLLYSATPPQPLRPRPGRARIGVAIAGYGVVGQALAARFEHLPDYDVRSILVRDLHRPRRVPPPCALTTQRRAFLDSDPDILIDVLSCAETGALLSEWALSRGIHIVSASKRVIAGCFSSLARCAQGTGARLLYSAAVGGETPILETVAAAAAERQVRSVEGVINGTVNFILDRLGQGLDFEAALAAAQAAGFAEADPSEDLSGADAAAKLRIIAATAFGGVPADYPFDAQPLDAEALHAIARSGEPWVQLARVERQGDRVAGGVSLVPRSSVQHLPQVGGEWNCAVVTLDDGSRRSCAGRGAGGAPTSSAILADLAQLAGTFGEPAAAPGIRQRLVAQ